MPSTLRNAVRLALIISTGLTSSTVAETGDTSLRTGLKGRVIERQNEGALPTRDAAGRVDAGYFRLTFTPVGIGDAAICPKRAFVSDAQFKRWRKAENEIYQRIFDKKGIWSITAQVAIRANGADATPRDLRLVSIETPEERNCKIRVVGTQIGDDAALDAASVLIPLRTTNTVYDDKVTLRLQSKYKLEPNGDRLDELWSGVKLFAAIVSAPLGPIVGALTPAGRTETQALLTDDVETAIAVPFVGQPRVGDRANRVFVYLAFPPLATGGTPRLSGGYDIALQYQASVFRRSDAFYQPSVPITAAEVGSATPIPSRDANAPTLLTVRQALDTSMHDALSGAQNPSAFDSACSIARPALRKLDLSDVDVDTYLWALASTAPAEAVSKHLDKLACFGPSERANLAKMGVTIARVEPPATMVGLVEIHQAMTNLGGLLQAASVAPDQLPNPDLVGRFADRINLVLADDAAATWLGLSELSGERPRDEVLRLLASKFSNIGCYAPRIGRDDLILPLRPRLGELPEKGRAGAALLLSREATPRPFIASLGFASKREGQLGQVATILVGLRGADSGSVVQELTKDRRPKSCADGWMDEVFR